MQFAEFLNAGSLERLRILFPPTCVGLRYGPWQAPLRDYFSAPASMHFTSARRLQLALAARTPRGDLPPRIDVLTVWTGTTIARLHVLRRVIPVGISCQRYGNMNPFPIDYASRPRLRGRLTLGRLTLPRKPQVFGGRVFHPSFRYSYRHSHFCYLQQASRLTFISTQNAPLPTREPRRHKATALANPVTSVSDLAPLHRRRITT